MDAADEGWDSDVEVSDVEACDFGAADVGAAEVGGDGDAISG